MTTNEILNQTQWTKRRRGEALFNLGLTRKEVADLLCNGNYGYAHNLWKKWNEDNCSLNTINTDTVFEFAFNRNFGVEVEFYNTSENILKNNLRRVGIRNKFEGYNHSIRNHWKFTSYSSIIGDNSYEMVSPVLSGNGGLKELKDACKALRLSKAKINKSCGVHVHLDVNDYTVDNMKTLLKNWYLLEKQLDKIMPVSRRGNNNRYCKGFSVVYSSKASFFSSIDSCNTINEMARFFNDRYFKLNLQSYLRYGTVEFRHHSGTTKYTKIKNWLLICSRLVEFSKENYVLVNDINLLLDENLKEYVEERELDFV